MMSDDGCILEGFLTFPQDRVSFKRERERKRDVRIRVYEPSIHGFEDLWGRKDVRRRRESVVSRKSLIARERGKN